MRPVSNWPKPKEKGKMIFKGYDMGEVNLTVNQWEIVKRRLIFKVMGISKYPDVDHDSDGELIYEVLDQYYSDMPPKGSNFGHNYGLIESAKERGIKVPGEEEANMLGWTDGEILLANLETLSGITRNRLGFRTR